jgi:DNA polymerase I-like protein with 3'-5' exonuclease and polymerase domains
VSLDFLKMGLKAQIPQIEKRPWMHDVTMELVTSETLDRVIDECIESKLYALDLETTGLDNRVFEGATKDKIVGFCLSPDGERGYYIPVRHNKGESHNIPVPVAENAMRRLVNSGGVAIFHNAKFDQEFLQFSGGEPIGIWDDPTSFEDTLILAYLRNSREKNKGLKHLSRVELEMEMIELKDLWENELETAAQKRNKKIDFSSLDPSWEPCVWYAASDAICTYRLFKKLHPQVIPPENPKLGQPLTYQLEKLCLPATRWMERCRVWIDQKKVAELMRLGQQEFYDCLVEVYDFCNEKLGRNVEPGWFRLLRDEFVADDPEFNINKQIEDARVRAHHDGLDRLDEDGHYIQVDTDLGSFPEKYDVLSRPQLGPLFQELRIPGLRKTSKSGQIKTTQDEVERLNDQHGERYPFLPKIKRMGELQKALGTYLISLHRDVGPDGTLRVNYNQLGTDTGRFTTPSSSRPEVDGGTKYPMHGTPATYDKSRPECLLRIREAIKCRDPGWVMAAIDFGGVELRIATNLSGEPLWLKEYFRCSTCGQKFEEGDGENTPEAPPAYCPRCGDDKIGDLHTLTALAFFGEERVASKQEGKLLRGMAKSSNFALAYGGGPNALVRAAGIPEENAGHYHRTFNNTYTTLKVWWDTVRNFGKRYGYVVTALGRHYPIPDIQLPTSPKSVRETMLKEFQEGIRATEPTNPEIREVMEMNRGFQAKAERNATNGPIQGTSADITKLAMGRIYRLVKDRGWFDKVRMIITIHDELVFELHKSIVVEALELFQHTMTRNAMLMKLKWKVPLTTDCEIGYDWTVPCDVKDFRFKRVRADGLQVDESGYLPRKNGKLESKLWPKEFVDIFGPHYGYAPVLDNPTEEEGKRLFGPNWSPDPLDREMPELSSDHTSMEDPTSEEVVSELEVSTPNTLPSGETMKATFKEKGPQSTRVSPPLEKGDTFVFTVPDIGIGVADKLAKVIVRCHGHGTHPLKVLGPDGKDLLWEDAKIFVNPIQFEAFAEAYGL